MNFFETQAGHNFFQYELPRLTQAMEDIAKALSHPVPVFKLTEAPDPDLLASLYHGGYDGERYLDFGQIRPLSRQVSQAETDLRTQLTPEACRLFDVYQRANDIRNDAVEAQVYAAGFRTAVQLFLAGNTLPSVTGGSPVWKTENCEIPSQPI